LYIFRIKNRNKIILETSNAAATVAPAEIPKKIKCKH
jgi:hypothetical protein